MSTPFASWKIQMAYLNWPTPKPYHSREKFLHILHKTEICAILAYFCLILVAMTTSIVLP